MMLEKASTKVARTSEPRLEPWPRAVAWLAVIAHFCVADVIGATGTKTDLEAIRNAAALAQADLILVWLVLGSSHWIRRVPWSLCGLCGVALVLYMHNFSKVEPVVLLVYLVHAITTAAVLCWHRFRGMRILCTQTSIRQSNTDCRSTRQFSILDMFGAALAVAIALSWTLRMQRPTLTGNEIEGIGMLSVVVAPFSLFTFLTTSAMRRERSLALRAVTLASIVICLSMFLQNGTSEHLAVPYSVHWLLVAATLWIFQMCGYRLIRVTKENGKLRSDEAARLAVLEDAGPTEWISKAT